jgi:hypothetical protein
MFIGHFAVGLSAKKVAPKISLGTLFLSALFLDLLWPIFLVLGLEHVRIVPGNTAFTPLDLYDYPFSHSLLWVIGWSLGFGLVYLMLRRYPLGAWVVGICVFSHWILDFITHRPDMPIFPHGPYVGLGLWNSVPATIIIEGALFITGVILYSRSTVAINRTGRYSFWALIIFLTISYIDVIVGTPPPNEKILAIVGLSTWLILPWGYWIDRHRRPISGTDSAIAKK